jgi:hypothetical protein
MGERAVPNLALRAARRLSARWVLPIEAAGRARRGALVGWSDRCRWVGRARARPPACRRRLRASAAPARLWRNTHLELTGMAGPAGAGASSVPPAGRKAWSRPRSFRGGRAPGSPLLGRRRHHRRGHGRLGRGVAPWPRRRVGDRVTGGVRPPPRSVEETPLGLQGRAEPLRGLPSGGCGWASPARALHGEWPSIARREKGPGDGSASRGAPGGVPPRARCWRGRRAIRDAWRGEASRCPRRGANPVGGLDDHGVSLRDVCIHVVQATGPTSAAASPCVAVAHCPAPTAPGGARRCPLAALLAARIRAGSARTRGERRRPDLLGRARAAGAHLCRTPTRPAFALCTPDGFAPRPESRWGLQGRAGEIACVIRGGRRPAFPRRWCSRKGP